MTVTVAILAWSFLWIPREPRPSFPATHGVVSKKWFAGEILVLTWPLPSQNIAQRARPVARQMPYGERRRFGEGKSSRDSTGAPTEMS
jgi:hypothetical protein